MQLVYDRKKGIGLQKCYCDKDQGWSVFWSGKAGYEVSYDSAITRKPGFSVASDADLSECNNKINRFKEDILNAAKTNRKISKFVEKHRDEMEL
ncbi:hypothetical protein HY988_05670 [Candidatus Micrarchaeota archaeon]|nr:hypothetical protein [Candidatus Micrarchaeota archaeon]